MDPLKEEGGISYLAVVAFSCLLEVYGASLIAQLVKNLPCGRPWFNSWVGKIHWRWDRLPNPSILGLPLWLNWSRIHLQWGRHGFDPWIGKIPGEGKDYPLQYSHLENSVHTVAKNWTRLSDFHFHFGGSTCCW